MPLRNLPLDSAASLSSLIETRLGQVSSKSLAAADNVAMTLLAFAPGESVSEEEYPGDTLYLCVEGKMRLVLPDTNVELDSGQVLCVPAHTQHAVEGADDAGFKILQITC